MIYVVTPTGGRKEAWSLCRRWMAQQTFSKYEWRWVVVHDCDPPPDTPTESVTNTMIRTKHRWEPGLNTHGANLRIGLAHIPKDAAVVFIEDDDWYSPEWLSRCVEALRRAEIYGEYGRTYYNVANMTYRKRKNEPKVGWGAALGATAIRGERVRAVLDDVLAADDGSPNPEFDVQLWTRCVEDGVPHRLDPGKHSVSIKGLPGRPGITNAHRRSLETKDVDGALSRLVGDADAQAIMEAARK